MKLALVCLALLGCANVAPREEPAQDADVPQTCAECRDDCTALDDFKSVVLCTYRCDVVCAAEKSDH